MFATTLTLTINSVAKVLNRVNQDNFGSTYRLVSADEKIEMKIRHSVDSLPTGPVNRHNVYIEWVVYATPSTTEKYYSATFTLREREASSPATLDHLSAAVLTLMGTLDSGLTVGEN